MRISDWSSDVCSSDLEGNHAPSAGRKKIVEAAEHAVRRRCIQGLAIIVDDPPAIADIVLVSLNQALVDIALIELSVAHECDHAASFRIAEVPMRDEIILHDACKGGDRNAEPD